jgi:methyl-accepting chemotaxis protein-1 (serine sensor receptor)
VTDIMGEIAAASAEQSRGIEQVNQAITQMDEVTQQNAALVEEAAAASKSLEDQGRQLNQSVSFFRLEGTAVSAPQVSSAAPRARSASANNRAIANKRTSAATLRPVTAAAVGGAAATRTDGWDTF